MGVCLMCVYICVCVHHKWLVYVMRVSVRMRVCVRACVRVCVCVRMRACVRVCAILTQHENGIPCNGPWPFPLSWPLSRAALVLASLHAMLL